MLTRMRQLPLYKLCSKITMNKPLGKDGTFYLGAARRIFCLLNTVLSKNFVSTGSLLVSSELAKNSAHTCYYS